MPLGPEQAWWDSFKGRCAACSNAVSSPRKHEMLCMSCRARNKGITPSRPGGAWNGDPVHKLFGCVYFAVRISNTKV